MKKWARAKVGRELVRQSSTLNTLLTTDADKTLTSTIPDIETTMTPSSTATAPFGRIMQLDFSPVLKFDNPISKYIGRHLFRQKEKENALTTFLDQILTTTSATDLKPNSRPVRKTTMATRRLPKRFRAKSPIGKPPMVLKMATAVDAPVTEIPALSGAPNNETLPRIVSSFSVPEPTLPTNPVDEYPPRRVQKLRIPDIGSHILRIFEF